MRSFKPTDQAERKHDRGAYPFRALRSRHDFTIARSRAANVDENQAAVGARAGGPNAAVERKTDTRIQNIECPQDPFCPEGWEEISKRV
ncbi:MAG: hypothetical protein IH606_15550 [Burkholderiales bacterium]|nr:hypothetical protein [Burkholderiales bacterium]